MIECWLLDDEEELRTFAFGEDSVLVYYVSGDGRVQVLDKKGASYSTRL